MKYKPTSWFQNPAEVHKCSAAVNSPADHSQRAKQAHRMVDRRVGQAVEFNQVGLHTLNGQLFELSLLLHDPQHMGRKIDR